jgi:serine/threonine-protein kinase
VTTGYPTVVVTRGDLLGDRYRLDEPIAAGGMGEVWRATDIALRRPVALKLVRTALLADRGFDARFRAEARSMAAVRHPNVVDIYDYGRAPLPGGDASYLVMALVDGQPLSTRIELTGGLPVGDTLSIVAQAADALHAAHTHGIVHRDVKPANLLVRPDGTVVLVDFGVARSTAASTATTGDRVVGTALYMAPEQASGRPVSPATDIYALGAVGYHCLTGRPPFLGTPLEVALRHVSDPPPPLPPGIPPAAGALMMRALAKNPRNRFPDAASFAAAARAAAAGRSWSTATIGIAGPPSRRRTRAAPAARTVLAAHNAVTTPYTLAGPDALAAPDATVRQEDRRRLAALAGVIGMVVLLGVVGLLVLYSVERSGGATPSDRPATNGPVNPPANQQPTTEQAPQTGTPAGPGALIPAGTPTWPAATAAPPSDQPTPTGQATPGGPGGPGTGNSADPGGPGSSAPAPTGPSSGGGLPSSGPGIAGSPPAQILNPSSVLPTESPLSGPDHGSAVTR